jgi:hypothetical protein
MARKVYSDPLAISNKARAMGSATLAARADARARILEWQNAENERKAGGHKLQ